MDTFIDQVTQIILAPVVEKGSFFSAPYVRFQRYLGCYQTAFETGVVLGHAFRDNLSTFAKLFSQPGREQEVAAAMQQNAREYLAELGKPENFLQLAMNYEEARIRKIWREGGCNEAKIEHLTKHWKMTVKQAFEQLFWAVDRGIRFGSTFPELTEQLWKDAYERPIDRGELEKWREAGLKLGDEEPGPIPLTDRQEQLVQLVVLFVTKYRPELLPEFEQPTEENQQMNRQIENLWKAYKQGGKEGIRDYLKK